LVATYFTSCNEVKEVSIIDDSSFYPVKVGEYRVYDVEEILYSNVLENDTLNYQLRESISDSIINGDRVTYALKREKRNLGDEWVLDSIWTFSITDKFLVISENNIPFIKLTFPMNITNTWDGNALNTRSQMIYELEKLEELLIDSLSLNDHVKLIIEDIPENVVETDQRFEVYGRGVGLIQKSYLSLNFCTETACGNFGDIISGRHLNQQLVALEK